MYYLGTNIIINEGYQDRFLRIKFHRNQLYKTDVTTILPAMPFFAYTYNIAMSIMTCGTARAKAKSLHPRSP